MKKKIASTFYLISAWLSKSILILLPLFFLPWTNDLIEFNKEYLLLFLILPAVLLYLLAGFLNGEIILRRTYLDMPIIIFLGLSLLSAIFSLDKFSSFFGFNGSFSDSWLGLSVFALLYFLLVNLSGIIKNLNFFSLLKIFLYAYGAALIINCLAFILILLKFSTINNLFNNLTDGLLPLSLVCSMAIVLVTCCLLVKENFITNIERWFLTAILILSIVFLFIINFLPAWVMLFIGSLLMLFYIYFDCRQSRAPLPKIKPLVFLIIVIISLTSWLLPNDKLFNLATGQSLERQISLSHKQAFFIAKQALINQPLLGSGPGTFSYDFSLYRPEYFNQEDFWLIRFNKSNNYILEILTTEGILPSLSYLFLVSIFLYVNFLYFKKNSEHNDEQLIVFAVSTAFIALFIAQFLYLSSAGLALLFWLFLGLLTVYEKNNLIIKETKITVNSKSKKIYLTTGIIFIFIGITVLIGYIVRFWLAEYAYAIGQGNEYYLEKAVRLNPYDYNYQDSLAKLYLNEATLESGKTKEFRNNQYIKAKIENSINSAKRAVSLNPSSVIGWETLAMVYRDIMPLANGSEPWAVSSFLKALELEPTNPVLATELAKAYLNDNKTDQAIVEFKKAIALKSDYYDASFGLAKAYLKDKKNLEALTILRWLTGKVSDPEIFYELGRLYFNQGDTASAILEFNRALEIAPTQIKALFSLATAYETKGDKIKALYYFKKVLELNPGDGDTAKRIQELSK